MRAPKFALALATLLFLSGTADAADVKLAYVGEL